MNGEKQLMATGHTREISQGPGVSYWQPDPVIMREVIDDCTIRDTEGNPLFVPCEDTVIALIGHRLIGRYLDANENFAQAARTFFKGGNPKAFEKAIEGRLEAEEKLEDVSHHAEDIRAAEKYIERTGMIIPEAISKISNDG